MWDQTDGPSLVLTPESFYVAAGDLLAHLLLGRQRWEEGEEGGGEPACPRSVSVAWLDA